MTAVLVALFLAPTLVGCNVMFAIPPSDDAQSLLQTVANTPDGLTLEIFQVRVPASDHGLYDELWQAVDEQRLDLRVRNQLVRNGFRAGVLTGVVPDRLARELGLESEPREVIVEQVVTRARAAPKVTRRVLQLNQRDDVKIQATDLQPELDVLVSGAGGVRGRTYRQVQAVYTLRAGAAPGQRVELRLTPELQHGELKNRYEGSDQGIFLMTQSREREVFDELTLTTALAAGELLVISRLSDASGSLGDAFHTHHVAGPAEHKLLLVRLVQVPASEILADVL